MSQTTIACYILMMFYRSQYWSLWNCSLHAECERCGRHEQHQSLMPQQVDASLQTWWMFPSEQRTLWIPWALGMCVYCYEIVWIPSSSDISCQHWKPKSTNITMWFKDSSYKLPKCFSALREPMRFWNAFFPSVQDVCEWILTEFSYLIVVLIIVCILLFYSFALY